MKKTTIKYLKNKDGVNLEHATNEELYIYLETRNLKGFAMLLKEVEVYERSTL